MILRRYRRAVHFLFFALMFAIRLLNLNKIYVITGTYYALNIGGLGMADPSAVLQTIFASGELAPPLLSSLLFPVLLALILGRVWCGWMCPYHVVCDGAAWVRSKFRAILRAKSEPEVLPVPDPLKANPWRYGFLLVGTAAAGVVSVPALNYVNAPGVLSTEAMLLVRERMVSVEIGFIALIVTLELFLCPRFWCRLLCPTGACLSLVRAPFTVRVRAKIMNQRGQCYREGLCIPLCPMGLLPHRQGGDLLCTNCARCVDACRDGKNVEMLGFAGSFQS